MDPNLLSGVFFIYLFLYLLEGEEIWMTEQIDRCTMEIAQKV